MPCYHPKPAKRAEGGGITFALRGEEPQLWIPCQNCLGCREQQQQQLAIRLLHESREASHKIFLTLTYDDEHEPAGLEKRQLQLFMKRLRRKTNAKIKYLACGEYGDRTQRPHYHAAMLGLAITDRIKWDSENYRSEQLEATWGQGIVTVSDLTDDRARYVAGYVLKKAGYRKQTYCDEDGVELEAPFRVMSKGMGRQWLKKYQNDLRHGYMQHDGVKYTIPRYYKDIIKKENKTLQAQIETEREKIQNITPDKDRLKTAEIIRQKQIRETRQRAQI